MQAVAGSVVGCAIIGAVVIGAVAVIIALSFDTIIRVASVVALVGLVASAVVAIKQTYFDPRPGVCANCHAVILEPEHMSGEICSSCRSAATRVLVENRQLRSENENLARENRRLATENENLQKLEQEVEELKKLLIDARRQNRDPYEILGVPKNAPLADVRTAHRRLAKKHHPDKNPGDKASDWIFREIQQAYEDVRPRRRRRK